MRPTEGQEPELLAPPDDAPADHKADAGPQAAAALDADRSEATHPAGQHPAGQHPAAAQPAGPEVQDPVPAGFASLRGDWEHASLPANVQLGQGCWLERRDSFARFRSERHPGLVLGDRVRVHTWTSFNIEPTGLVEVGDDCVLVGAVFMAAARIQLGQRVVVSYDVTLADSDFHPLDPELRRQDAIAIAPGGDISRRPAYRSAPIVVEDDVWIGIGAVILKGVRIGRGARIGAGTVISRDVPAGAVMEGNPAVRHA